MSQTAVPSRIFKVILVALVRTKRVSYQHFLALIPFLSSHTTESTGDFWLCFCSLLSHASQDAFISSNFPRFTSCEGQFNYFPLRETPPLYSHSRGRESLCVCMCVCQWHLPYLLDCQFHEDQVSSSRECVLEIFPSWCLMEGLDKEGGIWVWFWFLWGQYFVKFALGFIDDPLAWPSCHT